MKSYAILAAAFAALALAAPATVAERDHTLVFYTDTNFKGRSETVNFKEHSCSRSYFGGAMTRQVPLLTWNHSANLNRKVDDRVSSIRNEDKMKCHFYT